MDDFAPGRSDVDVLAIAKRGPTHRELASLVTLAADLGATAESPLDLRVVTANVASSPTLSPAMELYVRASRDALPDVERRVHEPDLLVELSVCRAHGRALAGVDPATVIGVVPDSWILAYGDEVLGRWESLTDDAAHAELMVLTACRIWRLTADGVHSSKGGAGAWALERDPSLTAVRDAL